jgi:YVTN family beta-propeller protein
MACRGAWSRAFAAAAALLFVAPGARPATPPQAPAWPCDAPPKPALVPAEIWAPTATSAAQDWRAEPEIVQLVNAIAPRSVPMAEAGRRVHDVARRSSPAVQARIAAGLIDTIDAERRLIVAGILRFNDRQEQLARRIEQGYSVADDAHDQGAGAGAGETRAASEEQLRWDTRIFEDRQRMLPIVCRQPAALEARLAGLIAAIRAPRALTPAPAAGDYLVYATNEGSGDISIIDPGAAREIGRIAIGKRPRGLVASPDGALLYVAVSGSPAAGPGVDEASLPPPDRAADGIVVIDLLARKVLRTLKGITDPEQIAISPDGARLYVASEDSGQLIVIGTDGQTLGAYPVGGEPEGVTVSADGATILATSEADHSLAVLRGTPPRLVGRILVGERPRNAVFLDRSRIVVPGEFDSSLSLVDIDRMARLRTIQLAGTDRPMGVVRLDGDTLLVSTGRGSHVVRVDIGEKSDGVTGAAPVGKRPWGLALSPDGTLAFSANGPSNDVSIIDPISMTEVARIDAGQGPWGIAAVPRHPHQ